MPALNPHPPAQHHPPSSPCGRSHSYPDRERQALFFRHYFGRAGRPKRLSEAKLSRLCAEANVFALASHLFWGVWAVVQARYSPIDFDYLAYHHLRIGELRRRKGEFLAQAAAAFGRAGEKRRRRWERRHGQQQQPQQQPPPPPPQQQQQQQQETSAAAAAVKVTQPPH